MTAAPVPPRNALIGSSVPRLEDVRLVTGRGRYVGDVAGPGRLAAVVVRSPVAHGLLHGIDADAARAMPGVHAVLTAEDVIAAHGAVPKIPLRQDSSPDFVRAAQPVIAHAVVRYVGEPVAVVIADTAALAEDAAELVGLDIASRPAVASITAARAADPLLFDTIPDNRAGTLSGRRGDADAAFARADYTRRVTFRIHRHTAVPMEPRGLLAAWDAAAGLLTLHGAAKVPFANRRILAGQLGLPEDAVRLVEDDVGGGFGVRGEFYPEDFLIPFAARTLARPVQWIEDRREHFLATNHAREMEATIEIACTRDGTILALRGTAAVDLGAYVRTTGATPARSLAQFLPGPYRIPDVAIDVDLMLTTKTPIGTYRGPGRFEPDFFRERLIDMAAKDLGIDRIEIRRKNLVGRDEMPWRLPTVTPLGIESACDSGDYAATFAQCLADFGWTEKAGLQGRLIDGRYHGIATGCYFEGGSPGPRESAMLRLEPDGRVVVHVGSSALGQGLETVMAQIAADALERPLDAIARVVHGSTDAVRDGFGSYSSRSVVMGGSAVLAAAETLKASIRAVAAAALGCAAEDVTLDDGSARGPDGRVVALTDLAEKVPDAEGTFAANARAYSYGAHAAHVAVDPATGAVEVLAYTAVEDVGRAINPATLHGQTVGAIVQGLGGTLLEEIVYNDDGEILTASLAEYLLPTAADVPPIAARAIDIVPAPGNPLGAKGGGEGGIIPVGGVIANAVANALSDFGIEPCALPLSPRRVWQMIRDAKQ
ncbi:xanthine dehydrogenase family protein molybdopterin-binding subunit [Rhodoplanes azumiensis]|uniref:Xanthine dehydrogenase family protein molybdopterin-binding subunit n=1 Tax=Rhodoplanes azumiensis TaxID=1897628 RepID=A0ABW5AMV0_9BRAD